MILQAYSYSNNLGKNFRCISIQYLSLLVHSALDLLAACKTENYVQCCNWLFDTLFLVHCTYDDEIERFFTNNVTQF